MTIEDANKHAAALAKKAAESERSEDALRFSQAACNLANALCALKAPKN
jgi:hypothetical protein